MKNIESLKKQCTLKNKKSIIVAKNLYQDSYDSDNERDSTTHEYYDAGNKEGTNSKDSGNNIDISSINDGNNDDKFFFGK